MVANRALALNLGVKIFQCSVATSASCLTLADECSGGWAICRLIGTTLVSKGIAGHQAEDVTVAAKKGSEAKLPAEEFDAKTRT